MFKKILPVLFILSIASGTLAQENWKEKLIEVWGTVEKLFYDPGMRGVNWLEVRDHYLAKCDKITDVASFTSLANEMLSELKTSHLYVMAPEGERQCSPGFGYIKIDEKLVVIEVGKGTEAEKSGMKPGWVILSSENRLKGTEGDTIALSFLTPSGKKRNLRLVYSRIPQPTGREQLVYRRLDNGIGYIAIKEMYDLAPYIDEAMAKLRECPGIIIDLRGCPGGGISVLRFSRYLGSREAKLLGYIVTRFYYEKTNSRPDKVNLTSLPVLKEYTRKALGELMEEYGGAQYWTMGCSEKNRYKGKIAVLIDRRTYCTAEAVAWYLRTEANAVLIGEKTPGYLLSAEYFPISGGWKVRIPVADVKLSDGSTLEGVGVSPNITVSYSIQGLIGKEDPFIKKAKEILTK
jgi:C-terminal processing protease CtpA/Prc